LTHDATETKIMILYVSLTVNTKLTGVLSLQYRDSLNCNYF